MRVRLLLCASLMVIAAFWVTGCGGDDRDDGASLEQGPGYRRGPEPPRDSATELTREQRRRIKRLCGEAVTVPEGSVALSDMHVHVPMSVDQVAFAEALLTDMNAHGYDRSVIQPDHSPAMTANAELLSLMRRQETLWGDIHDACPRLLRMIYAFDPAADDAAAWVRGRLETGNYAGVGEIEFLHSRMSIRKPMRGGGMDEIYAMLAERKGALHFQVALWKEPEMTAPLLELVEGHPDVQFVWFGCGQEVVSWNKDNLWCDMFVHEEVGSPGAAAMRTSVFGTDTGPTGFPAASARVLPFKDLGEAAAGARALIGQLDPETAAMIAHGNFDRIFRR